MPTDPETMKALGQVTTAIGYVGDAVKGLSSKIDTVSAEGRAEQKEAQARLEANAADTRMRLHDLRNDMHVTLSALDRNVAQLETGLENHIRQDAQEFDRIGAVLSDSEKALQVESAQRLRSGCRGARDETPPAETTLVR